MNERSPPKVRPLQIDAVLVDARGCSRPVSLSLAHRSDGRHTEIVHRQRDACSLLAVFATGRIRHATGADVAAAVGRADL